jgi:hypothetical protein
MTTESPEPEGRTNTALIVLGLAAVLLIGSVVGFLIGGGQSPEPTPAPSSTTTPSPPTTTTVATTTTTAPTTTTTAPAPTEFEFPASEDTTVNSSTPIDVLGSGELLQTEQEEDDIIHTLIRFEVSGLPTDAVIAGAVLRLTVLDESSVPGEVSRVGGTWTEAETTWETAPPIGAPISPLPGGMEGAVLDIDVTSVVTGPGVFDFYLTTSSSDGMDFAAREAPAGGPTLVIRLGDEGDASGAAEGTVLVGAGDIAACNSQGDEATAAVLVEVVSGAEQAVVFTAGDNAYPSGSERNFLDCYDPSWGAFKDITRPALGSREYRTAGAGGHFDYFGVPPGERDKGYYSYDLAGWHIVVLNSNCDQIGGCEAGSAQEIWLREDLAASSAVCTLAYWHHPLFSSGSDGGVPDVLPLFQALYDADAEVVINGDDHFYERFAPQDPAGEEEDEGIRQFIVGTGGSSLSSFGAGAPNSEVRFSEAFGVLALTLLPDGYEWAFMSVAGSDFNDPGTGTCQ